MADEETPRKRVDLGQALQLLGNAGVIVGILLLVYELNQNRELMMAQTRHELSQGTVELLLELSNDPEDAVYYRGNAGEELTEHERMRYTMTTVAQMRLHEDIYYQYRNGLYDEDEYLAQREAWRNVVYARKGFAGVFCERRSGFSPAFVAEISSILTTYGCE